MGWALALVLSLGALVAPTAAQAMVDVGDGRSSSSSDSGSGGSSSSRDSGSSGASKRPSSAPSRSSGDSGSSPGRSDAASGNGYRQAPDSPSSQGGVSRSTPASHEHGVHEHAAHPHPHTGPHAQSAGRGRSDAASGNGYRQAPDSPSSQGGRVRSDQGNGSSPGRSDAASGNGYRQDPDSRTSKGGLTRKAEGSGGSSPGRSDAASGRGYRQDPDSRTSKGGLTSFHEHGEHEHEAHPHPHSGPHRPDYIPRSPALETPATGGSDAATGYPGYGQPSAKPPPRERPHAMCIASARDGSGCLAYNTDRPLTAGERRALEVLSIGVPAVGPAYRVTRVLYPLGRAGVRAIANRGARKAAKEEARVRAQRAAAKSRELKEEARVRAQRAAAKSRELKEEARVRALFYSHRLPTVVKDCVGGLYKYLRPEDWGPDTFMKAVLYCGRGILESSWGKNPWGPLEK